MRSVSLADCLNEMCGNASLREPPCPALLRVIGGRKGRPQKKGRTTERQSPNNEEAKETDEGVVGI
jgi:hypothetical protein